jgi:hypothetical protein
MTKTGYTKWEEVGLATLSRQEEIKNVYEVLGFSRKT